MVLGYNFTGFTPFSLYYISNLMMCYHLLKSNIKYMIKSGKWELI